jgi:hypothetical protein
MGILVGGFEIVIVSDSQHVVQLNLSGHEIVVHFTDQSGHMRLRGVFPPAMADRQVRCFLRDAQVDRHDQRHRHSQDDIPNRVINTTRPPESDSGSEINSVTGRRSPWKLRAALGPAVFGSTPLLN